MNREIKFRAWDLEEEVMIDWFQFMCRTTTQELYELHFRSDYELLIPMQYTGLKDKNGVEIYEGDIAIFDDGSGGEVAWREGGFAFADGSNPMLLGLYKTKDLEVIGNIYENPELLQEGSLPS